MLYKRNESTEVDRRTWLHVPSIDKQRGNLQIWDNKEKWRPKGLMNFDLES